jgi:hypothetical protein
MSDDSGAVQVRRWRQKAEELRTEADQMKNPFARQSLVRMAQTYERLADDYEKKAAGKTVPKPEAG